LGYPAATQRACPEKPAVMGPPPFGRRAAAIGAAARRKEPPSAFRLATAHVYHNEAAPCILFTVRTGDERIAPESLTCHKSLFVRHNMSARRENEALPIVKDSDYGRNVTPWCARCGRTQKAFPVNRPNTIFIARGGCNCIYCTRKMHLSRVSTVGNIAA